jgi:aspartate aminotransferase-like enzyme
MQGASPVTVHTCKHFLQIPGPTNVPDRVLRAMDMPTIDHRGPEFAQLGLEVLEGCKAVFRTKNPVVIYPSSGTGAWEAAIVNTLSPGDKVLMVETGHFATLWKGLAEKFKLDLMLMGTLSGVEMALDLAKVPHQKGSVLAAMDVLNGKNAAPVSAATNSAAA